MTAPGPRSSGRLKWPSPRVSSFWSCRVSRKSSRPGTRQPVESGRADAEFSNEIIGLLMIGAMLFAIFIGFPISFTLIFLGLVFGTWAFGIKTHHLPDDAAVLRLDDGADPRGCPVIRLHGFHDGTGRADGAIIRGRSADAGADEGLALCGCAVRRRDLWCCHRHRRVPL